MEGQFSFGGKAEREYLKFCTTHESDVFRYDESSPQMGFDYLFQTQHISPKLMIKSVEGFKNKIKNIFIMAKYIGKILKGQRDSFKDVKPYIEEMKNGKDVENNENPQINSKLWDELTKYAKEEWDIAKIGFTEVPNELIFQDKSILFKYALVLIQEMKKEKIDYAPDLKASDEVMRVYADLGIAANKIAEWLREKGIICQSNHPLGGLTLTPPLAGMAGLGWQGRSGNLITREFGTRQRITPIFIKDNIFEFTYTSEHKWIEKYCDQCGMCVMSCPTNAIFEERKLSVSNIPKIGAIKTCIDIHKCFPMFLKTRGCSICLKVCPFSNGPKVYDKLKKKFNR